jgi:mono/diheme cytochrome c family protein
LSFYNGGRVSFGRRLKEHHMKQKGQLAILTLIGISLATPGFAQQSGEATYKAKCAMCHGADGLGETPAGKAMKANSFKSDADVKASDADLIKVTKDGKGKMPAYTGKLTDAQIQEVVTYIRTLQK